MSKLQDQLAADALLRTKYRARGIPLLRVPDAVNTIRNLEHIVLQRTDELSLVVRQRDEAYAKLASVFPGHAYPARTCCNENCTWTGFTDRMLGNVGPLCPECGEVTEPVVLTRCATCQTPNSCGGDGKCLEEYIRARINSGLAPK
jgi:hypothetical protein